MTGSITDRICNCFFDRGAHILKNSFESQTAFSVNSDAAHRFYRFKRKAADCCFTGEHYCIGTVKNGIRHITGLSPGRAGIANHTVQHLSCCNNWLTKSIAFSDELFLQQRNFFSRYFHSQIAPGNHYSIGNLQDGIKFIDTFTAFNFCDNHDVTTPVFNQTPDFQDIFCAAGKRSGQKRNLVFQG